MRVGTFILPTLLLQQPSTFEHIIFLSSRERWRLEILNVAGPLEISTHSGMRNVGGRVCVWGALF